jgi:hypothetical protein
MFRKAQAETALILGLVVIAIIVAAYAYSSFTAPFTDITALSEEQRSVDAYVRDAIMTAAIRTLGKIYGQGGYYDASSAPRTLNYMNLDIAYWQVCDDVDIPDIEDEVEKGVYDYLRRKLPVKTDIAGRQVEFTIDALDIGARVFENKISLSVNLPTKVDGVPLPQPFTLDVESKLGRIYDFAVDFSNYQKEYRKLEQNLMKHINISNPDESEEGACWLPTLGLYDGTLSRGWTMIEKCMEMQIDHTLSHTFEWEKPWLMSDGTLSPSLLKNAYIFQIKKSDESWGQYADLEVEFRYGGVEGRLLTRNEPEFYLMTDPDPLIFRPQGIPGVLSITAYDVKYDISFPVVISVRDEILERNFNFVNFVNIKDSRASNQWCMESEPPDPQTEACRLEVAGEEMDLTVTDTDGTPLPNVYVQFGPCKFDSPTDADGRLPVPTPILPGDQVLTLGKGEMEYNVSATTEELVSEKVVAMPIYETYDMYFYTAYIDSDHINLIAADNYNVMQKMDVSFTMKTDDNPVMAPYVFSYDNWKKDFDFSDYDPNAPPPEPEDLETVLNQRSDIEMPATQTYRVELSLRGDGIVKEFACDFELEKDEDIHDIYIYAPIIPSGTSQQAVLDRMDACGLSIVSHTPPSEMTGVTVLTGGIYRVAC